MEKELIAVAMSGGVDSSVVAALLHSEEQPIVGMTMQLWNQQRMPELIPEGGATGRCCSLDDVYDARWVAESLGVPFYVVNFDERLHHLLLEALLKIHHVERHAQRLGDPARIVHVVKRAGGGAAVRRRLRLRAHADPLHAVQQLHQV